MKKLIVSLIIGFSLLGAVFMVSASYEVKTRIAFIDTMSDSIFLGISGLSDSIIVYNSNQDISNYTLHSNCHTSSKYIGSSGEQYFFYLSYLSDCSNNTILLKNEEKVYPESLVTFKFFDQYEIYNKFLDYSSEDLQDVLYDLGKKRRTFEKYKNIDVNGQVNFSTLTKKRKYNEVVYVHSIISDILESREYPYLIPIDGYGLPTQKSHMPNFSRAYRKDYTDGIHHGWDIFAPNKTPVQAIDRGIIIKIVDDFQYEDLSRIKKGANLSEDDMLKNLDILRGNQVWLKTMKGEIVFYSHLDSVSSDIQVGEFVNKGTVLGKTGITGVPERDYSHYHLHFEIQKNPYDISKAGKYTLDDYLRWDWLLRGLSMEEVKIKQNEIFTQ